MMTKEIYVMRVWQDSEDSETWSVTMTDRHEGETYTFANLDKFVTFFKDKLENSRTSSTPSKVRATFGTSPLLTRADSEYPR
jgi:hypothetical protein